jgi:lipopolysaccharide biosynthesis glycosyltransferase
VLIRIWSLQAEYLDVKEWFSTVSAAVSPSGSFIQAMVKTDKPIVSKTFQKTLLPHIFYFRFFLKI